jgi:hypothetical protein
MVAATHHHPIHFPTALGHALHAVGRFVRALFFTVLAPLVFALAIMGGLLLAIGLGRLI